MHICRASVSLFSWRCKETRSVSLCQIQEREGVGNVGDQTRVIDSLSSRCTGSLYMLRQSMLRCASCTKYSKSLFCRTIWTVPLLASAFVRCIQGCLQLIGHIPQ